MLRSTRLADYAVAVIYEMAQKRDSIYSSSCLSEVTKIAKSTLEKILKLLVKGGVLGSVRGASGGYVLKTLPEEISLLQIINAIEGEINITSCAVSEDSCNLTANCNVKEGWNIIENTIKNSLKDFTIADFIKSKKVKDELLKFSKNG